MRWHKSLSQSGPHWTASRIPASSLTALSNSPKLLKTEETPIDKSILHVDRGRRRAFSQSYPMPRLKAWHESLAAIPRVTPNDWAETVSESPGHRELEQKGTWFKWFRRVQHSHQTTLGRKEAPSWTDPMKTKLLTRLDSAHCVFCKS